MVYKKNIKRNKVLRVWIKNRFLILFIMILIFGLIIFNNDIRNYIIFIGKTINLIEDKECSEWEECKYSYNLDYLYGEIYLTGEQSRICFINSNRKIETRRCVPKKPITTKVVGDILEIYSDEKLIAKLELTDEEIDKLDIEIVE